MVQKTCLNCKDWDLWTTDGACVTCEQDGVLTNWKPKEDDHEQPKK